MAETSTPLRRRRNIIAVHRWLSLAAASFWVMQALTGILIVFHWEIVDRSIATVHRPTDLAAIERRIETVASSGAGAQMRSVWTTAGLPDRYNINFEDRHGTDRSVRVAGDGTVLHARQSDAAPVMRFLVDFHHDLLLSSWGSWILSISGILLCTNLVMGLVAAWPRRGTWRAALIPARRGSAAARLYSWHRAVGLWAAAPALVVAACGTMLAFEDGVGALVGAQPVSLPPNAASGEPIGFAAAASAALAAIPGSSLTQVAWPKGDDATYMVRVRAPDEMRRAYGASVVLVDANDASIRGTFPIGDAAPGRSFMMALFPIHTGEAGGLAGRLLTIAVGLWLITMIVAGLLLWVARRRRA